MPVFRNYDELHTCLGKLFDEAKCDPRIAPKIRDSRLIIQFRYQEPTAIVTIDASRPPTQENAYFDVLWGEQPNLKPDVEMSMKADVAHKFWHGSVNLMAALARQQIIAKGPIPKILKLLPAVSPMYQMYPRILTEMHRQDLVLSS